MVPHHYRWALMEGVTEPGALEASQLPIHVGMAAPTAPPAGRGDCPHPNLKLRNKAFLGTLR